MAEKTKGINASDLKYIAILAMLIDHVAYLFVADKPVLYAAMRTFGRITAPVMCFFISEGYHYTRSLKKYFGRLAVCAVISNFAFNFAFYGNALSVEHESMIATLMISLAAVHIVRSEKLGDVYRIPLILIMTFLAEYCDWGSTAVIFTLVFELGRESGRKKQVAAYSIAVFALKILPLISTLLSGSEVNIGMYKNFGLYLAVPLLLLYNGEKGGGKYTKWVFYIFYPAHLFVLGYINYKF